MKIIKVYAGSQALKEYSLCPSLDQEAIIDIFGEEKGFAVIDDLKYKSTVLICKEWFDPQSFFRGTNYYIDSIEVI